ncbi:hypothetical protein ACWEO2_44195, partial [Nocardia sp. NPDC004278]
MGTRIVAVTDSHRIRHGFMAGERGIDLTEFDTQTTNLDLEIRSTQMLDRTIAGPTHDIAGAIHTLARNPRTRNETLRRRPRPTMISTREQITRDIQLTRHTRRNRLQPLVEDPDRGA